MNALVLLIPSVVLVVGAAQESISGTRGPVSLETVVGAAIIIVVGMFLWFLRWQKKLELEERGSQSKMFETALDRILNHDKQNHDQAMDALREITRTNQAIREQMASLDCHRRPA